jgi:hypothetical protein
MTALEEAFYNALLNLPPDDRLPACLCGLIKVDGRAPRVAENLLFAALFIARQMSARERGAFALAPHREAMKLKDGLPPVERVALERLMSEGHAGAQVMQ